MADIGPIRGRRFGRMHGRFDRTASVRLKRLLVAGLCRCGGGDLPDLAREAVDILERVADRLDPPTALLAMADRLRREAGRLSAPLEEARRSAYAEGHPYLSPEAASGTPADREARLLRDFADIVRDAARDRPDRWRPIVELRRLAIGEHVLDPGSVSADEIRARMTGVLTDLVVTTLGPISFDPRWRTGDVLGLARGIYDDRAFNRIPILADALIDAGCDRSRIIDHCREPGPHYRGCWVVDAALGLR
jgi:hypothetical protein